MLGALAPISFVPVSDRTAARRFYVEVLGLDFVEESPFALVIRSGGSMIRVTPVEGHEPAPHTVLGWIVPDIAVTLRALGAKGISARRYDQLEQDDLGIWQSPDGARVAWFADPDGNVLSLTQFPAGG